MDTLKRNLVIHKLSYEKKNNLIEKEAYKLGYDTKTSSAYLAGLLFSEYKNIIFDYRINDSTYHGYIKSSDIFINIIFLEYGYNFISYSKDGLKYLKEVSDYFKKYLVENNLEKELDVVNLYVELRRIDNIISYYDNKDINATYDLYLYFYEEKSELITFFETYINNYIERNLITKLTFKTHPITELLDSINDKSILNKLEYYDLFKNGLSYEKIFNSIVNKNVSKESLMNHYSISERTASILMNEYEIYNNVYLQDEEIMKLLYVNQHKNNLEIIEEAYIRSFYLYSSKILSLTISQRFKKILYKLVFDYIDNGLYLNQIPELLSKIDEIDGDKKSKIELGIAKFCEYLDKLNDSRNNDSLIDEVIYKFIEEIKYKNNNIGIELHSLNNVIKMR